MSVRRCVSLLGLASLLLFQFAAAESDPSSTCAENCRFVVVPSLGPAGPAGPPGLNGTKGDKGDKGDRGDAATLDTSTVYSKVQLSEVHINQGKTVGLQIWDGSLYENAFENGWLYNAKFYGTTEIGVVGNDQEYANPVTMIHSPRIYNGVLSGATTLENGAALNSPVIASPTITGATSIGEGATILRPNITAPIIDGATSIGEGAVLVRPGITAPTITGATSIGEGATILRPSITAPIIDGATSIGSGATILRPIITAPIIDGDTIIGKGATINAPKITDSLHMTGVPILSQSLGDPFFCEFTQIDNRIEISNYALKNVSGEMVPDWGQPSCIMGYGNIGAVIEWPDGKYNFIVDTEGNDRIRFFSVTASQNRTATWAKVSTGNVIATSQTTFTDRISLRGSDGSGTSIVTIDMTKMKKNGRTKSFWSFPNPLIGPVPVNYFVSEDLTQTLTNKKFDRLRGAPAIVTSRIESAGGTNGTVWFEPGSNAIAGLVSVRVGLSPATRGAVCQIGLGGSAAIPAFVSLTAANIDAAKITTSWVSSATQSEFYVGVETQLSVGVKYQWYYQVMG